MPITRGSVLAGSAITANADPVCRTDTGSRMPPSRDVAALPPAAASSVTSSVTLPKVTVFAAYSNRGIGAVSVLLTEHYEVPPDFDANVPLHPSTRHWTVARAQ
jgi:hypothetical protein